METGSVMPERVPYCVGGKLMHYVRTDPGKGHLFMCPARGGCELRNAQGARFCNYGVWLRPEEDPRREWAGGPRTPGIESRLLERCLVERVDSRPKETRRLGRVA